MALLPDLQSLHAAAAAVERTADRVEADAGAVHQLVEAIPWHGPRRQRILASVADGVVAPGRGQAAAERALARSLRELAGQVERELEELARLAAAARRHLEELLARARIVVTRAAQEVAEAVARGVAAVVVELVTADPAGALRAAEAVVERVEGILASISHRLAGLPEPTDPAWRRLGTELLRWQPL